MNAGETLITHEAGRDVQPIELRAEWMNQSTIHSKRALCLYCAALHVERQSDGFGIILWQSRDFGGI
jgi:hypothetical protein